MPAIYSWDFASRASRGPGSGAQSETDPAPGDDWVERSTEQGVVLADPLITSTKMVATATISPTQWVLANGTQDHITLDVDGWRFAILNSDTTASGDVGVYFGNLATFGPGSVFWGCYEVYGPPEYCWAPWKYNTATGGGSHKSSIMSDSAASNRPNEVVVQMNNTANGINGYWQDGVSSSVLSDVGIDTSGTGGSSSDIRRQPAIDRGVNPLTGNNPDTGSAWSAYEQTRARYGLLYAAQSGTDFRRGFGDPFSGEARQVPNEWNTILLRIAIGDWGAFNSRLTLLRARQGLAPEVIHDVAGVRLGSGPAYNTLWLTPYTSDRQSGGRKVSAITNPIAGLTVNGMAGLDTPIGDGQLEYNASTGRVRFQPAGGSYGTARGFSSANGILTRNVISNAGGDEYLIVTANPASLPSSGTHTATITVADGRPDTYAKYRRPIISRHFIKAPGGFVPSSEGALAAAAAGMAAGSWLDVSSYCTGLGIFTGGTGASGSRLTYGFQFPRDPVNRRWLMHIGDHAENAMFATFNELTATFAIDHTPTWGDIGGAATARHMYAHPDHVQKTAKFYTRTIQDLNLRRWNGSGNDWTDVPIPLFYHTSAAGHCYHKGLDKFLVFQLESGINGALVGMDPDTEVWSTLVSAASGTLANTGDPHNFCRYNENSDIAWFGGGNGVTTNWTIDGSGTVQAASAIPGPLGSIGPSGDVSLAFANPANGNFIVIRDDSIAYDFDATARTYSSHSAYAFPGPRLAQFDGSAGGMAGCVACPIYEWGVVAVLTAWSRSSAAKLYFLKP